MQDIKILLDNKPGSLALMGETLGWNKVSLEGGGVFQNGEVSIAHCNITSHCYCCRIFNYRKADELHKKANEFCFIAIP